MNMTFKQYCDNYLENSRYGAKYKELGLNSDQWKECKGNLLIKWKEEVLKHAENYPLETKVIVSWGRQFGEWTIFRTFRGKYEKGIKNYKIPKKFHSC